MRVSRLIFVVNKNDSDMKLKKGNSNLEAQQIIETINQITTVSAIAALTIAKHTNINKTNAMFVGVGASLLVTGLIKCLED
jgi:hypothetical protein